MSSKYKARIAELAELIVTKRGYELADGLCFIVDGLTTPKEIERIYHLREVLKIEVPLIHVRFVNPDGSPHKPGADRGVIKGVAGVSTVPEENHDSFAVAPTVPNLKGSPENACEAQQSEETGSGDFTPALPEESSRSL